MIDLMHGQYILVGQTPVPEPDPIAWADWFGESDRHVAVTCIFDIAAVSTVFLGLDCNFFPMGEPLLFETMIFWQGEHGGEQDRCCTWLEAEQMHKRMVREASSPGLIFAHLLRHLLRQAREAWDQAWSELREAIGRA